ncbi:hypothetical protein PAAG_02145 [Paracoccidioides lutzii Pb01]|uniref:Uncharacterized protein n=1 Tax=Paracoccidioides lutzii (strain ATCC MYA-826 / Pb01) TaxID=502779 RepID=C1GUF0_PARBA|nr:hypothetical protein PAAG_02145 [Paracoccidioides lutzii Pb01]EEH39956.1 hypothetical protein PAAG_02145 [Paracoccidioides lutzii Pb01]
MSMDQLLRRVTVLKEIYLTGDISSSSTPGTHTLHLPFESSILILQFFVEIFPNKSPPPIKMKSFYTLALLITATVISSSPVPVGEPKLLVRADAEAMPKYFFYVVPPAVAED